jgi:hypothetical protein
MSALDPATAIPDPLDPLDEAVLAVDGVAGLFPAQRPLALVSDRILAAVTGSGASASVVVATEGDGEVVTARLAAASDRPVRETARRVADRLAELHPDPSTVIRVQVARIQ